MSRAEGQLKPIRRVDRLSVLVERAICGYLEAIAVARTSILKTGKPLLHFHDNF
jgi:hypothetical protein